MAKRMSDDDVMDYVYGQLFGDLDGLESKALFDEDKEGLTPNDETPENASPASGESGGVKITIEPVMAAAQEGGKPPAASTGGMEGSDEEEEDKLKGIGRMSPLMAHLHGNR